MRGDSLRDFYAKAMALFGLGLLAVAGAVFDYWPISTGLPQVADALVAPMSATPIVASPFDVPQIAATAPPPTFFADLSLEPGEKTPPAAAVVEQAITDEDQPLALAPVGYFDVAPVALELLAAPSIDLTAPPRAVLTEIVAPTRQVAANQSGDNLLRGVAKKTGASFVKTGEAIVSAFGLAGRAVKKLNPF